VCASGETIDKYKFNEAIKHWIDIRGAEGNIILEECLERINE